MSWDYFADPRPDIPALCRPPGEAIPRCRLRLRRPGWRAESSWGRARGWNRVRPTGRRSSSAARRCVGRGQRAGCSAPVRGRRFDYLIFADVLEHLPEPSAALRRCLPFLAPDGRVIVSVPNFRFYLVLLRLILRPLVIRRGGHP